MGCWNGTDGLGGLPLRSGSKVKAVIILNKIDMPEASGFSYSCGYADPISFILDAKYNDYGGIEGLDENSKSAILLKEYFEKNLESGDMKVTPDYSETYDIDKDESEIKTLEGTKLENFINDFIERDRVYMKRHSWGGRPPKYVNIGLQMFSTAVFEEVQKKMFTDTDWDHRDFTEEILTNDTTWYLEDVFETKKLSEKDINLIESFEIQLEDSEIDDTKRATIKRLIRDIESGDIGFRQAWDNTNTRKSGDWSNIVRMFSQMETVNSLAFSDYHRAIDKMYKDEDKVLYSKMFSDMISLIRMVSSLRKSWQGGSGKGGQDFDETAFVGLMEGIKRQIVEAREDYTGEKDWDARKNAGPLKKGAIYDVIAQDYEGYTVELKIGEFTEEIKVTESDFREAFGC